MSKHSVYKAVAKVLENNPDFANTIPMDQLAPIINLGLLEDSTRINEIYSQRGGMPPKPKPRLHVQSEPEEEPIVETKPVPKPRPRQPDVVVKPVPVPVPRPRPRQPDVVTKPVPKSRSQPDVVTKPVPVPRPRQPDVVTKPVPKSRLHKVTDTIDTLIDRLVKDYKEADNMTQQELESVLKTVDKLYYDPDDENVESPLDDKVYDYIKRLYGQRLHLSTDKTKTMKSVSSETGVGYKKPVRGRDVKLPVKLMSMDNMFYGEGDVDKWTSKHIGSFLASAKMDGTSALYWDGKLYTRGDASFGRDISHIIPYLNLPDIAEYNVRGEIVINKHIFADKHKRVGRVNTRNSVAGALGSINNIDYDFIKDFTFVAYEIIMDNSKQMAPSEQFKQLKKDGFTVAENKYFKVIDDTILSEYYMELIQNYEFDIDGLVVYEDKEYIRTEDKNPEYARAYKEALECLIAPTVVTDIEWNASKYGYLIPTILYKPVSICGVTLRRATGESARYIKANSIGIGAEIEIIYHGKVNPRVFKVLKPVEPTFPKVAYKWNDGDDPVHIIFDEDAEEDEDSVSEIKAVIQVKKLYKFVTDIGAKGIGETTIKKLYDKGYTTIGDLLTLEHDDISFLGEKTSVSIVNSIQSSFKKITGPVLLTCSNVFGRGMGKKKFDKIFRKYPDILRADPRYSKKDLKKMILTVDGFADKTTTVVVDGIEAFWDFIESEIPDDVYKTIIQNTIDIYQAPEDDESSHHENIKGKKICITGFRDAEISDFIEKNGGSVQNTCTGATDIVVISKDGYENKKTETAVAKNIPIMTRAEFVETYFS